LKKILKKKILKKKILKNLKKKILKNSIVLPPLTTCNTYIAHHLAHHLKSYSHDQSNLQLLVRSWCEPHGAKNMQLTGARCAYYIYNTRAPALQKLAFADKLLVRTKNQCTTPPRIDVVTKLIGRPHHLSAPADLLHSAKSLGGGD